MFRALADVVSPHPWPQVRTRPSYGDLAVDELSATDRQVSADLLAALDLGSTVLYGPANTGKTFLALAVSRAFLDARPEGARAAFAFYADQYDILDERVLDVVEETSRQQQDLPSLFVVDDAHLAPTSRLISLLRLAERPNIHVLLVSHQHQPPITTAMPDWPPYGRRIRRGLDPQTEAFIIRRFLGRRTPSGVPSVPDGQIDELVTQVGGDLDRAVHILTAWSAGPGTTDLAVIDEEEILQFTAQDLGLDLTTNPGARAHPSRIRLYHRTASAAQRSLALPLDALPDDEVTELATVQGVLDVRHVHRSPGDGRPDRQIVVFRDEKAPRYVVTAIERMAAISLPSTADYLRPLMASAHTAWFTARRLAEHKEGEVLATYLSDGELVETLRSAMVGHSGPRIVQMLKEVQQALAPEVRVLIAPLMDSPVLDHVIDGLRGTSANTVRKSLSVLHHVVHLSLVFDGWSEQDWTSTVSRARLNTLRLLSYDFRLWHLREPVAALARALGQADWNPLLQAPGLTLRRDINGLIGNIAQDVPECVPALFPGLATADLSVLISVAPLADVSWLLNKLQALAPDDVEPFLRENVGSVIQNACTATGIDALHVLLSAAAISPDVARRFALEGPAELDVDVSVRHRAAYAELLRRLGRPTTQVVTVATAADLELLLTEAGVSSIAVLSVLHALHPVAGDPPAVTPGDVEALSAALDERAELLTTITPSTPAYLSSAISDLITLRAGSRRRPTPLSGDDRRTTSGTTSLAAGSSLL